MQDKSNLLNFSFLMCFWMNNIVAVQDQRGIFNYICSFFYKNNQQLNNKVLSFDERLTLFGEQFKDVSKSADFDIRIMALETIGRTHQECVECIDETKRLLQKNHSLKNSFYEVYIAQNVNNFLSNKIHADQHESYLESREKRSADEKLHDAYHEAGHAAALILSDDKLVALSYLTIKGIGYCTGIKLSPYLDGSDDDFINNKKNKLEFSLAGGIGEQIFKVPCNDRISDDFDENDKEQENYNFLECTSRNSVGQDFDYACEEAEFIFRWNHKYFDKNHRISVDDFGPVMLEAYESIRPKLELNKDKISKLAHRLIEKETVYADEAYEIFGKKRPKFYFEK